MDIKVMNQKDKSILMYRVKTAKANEKFFSKETMKFFGPQKFSIVIADGKPLFKIVFTERHPRTTYYSIDPKTYQLNHENYNE